MDSIFIDCNCINAKQKDLAMNELEQLYEDRKIFLEVSDTMSVEFSQEKSYKPGLMKASKYIESHGPMVLGHSRLGHCVISSNEDVERLSLILSLLWGVKKRNQYSSSDFRDAKHIDTAIRNCGDYFVTREKNLLKKSDEIWGKFNLLICTPEECLIKVKERLNKAKQRLKENYSGLTAL